MRFDVLGPLRVTDGDRVVDIARPKERALLAALVVEAGSVVPLDRLVNQLWGDEPPARAIGTVHAYISNLRRLLEPERPPRAPSSLLVSRTPGYVLVVAPDDIDAARFEQLTARGRAALEGDPAAALAAYDEALGLWRGPAYADFVYDDFAAAAARRLEELRLVAVESRVDALLALGRHDVAVADVQAALASEPLRERLWGQLVVALYRSARQADALDACRRARAALDELGLEPSHQLRRLEQAVLRQSSDLDLPAPAVVGGTSAPVEAAPVSNPLPGRTVELADLDRAVTTTRTTGRGALILVSGEAGIGKTALAAEALDRAAAAGLTTASAHCPDGSAAPVLWPCTQLLRRLGDGALPDDVAALADDVQAGGGGRQTQLMTRILDALRSSASRDPLALLVDDVQWADESSLRLLQLVVTDLAASPVVLVVTLRTPVEQSSAELEALLSTMRRAPHGVEMALRPLDAAATRALVDRVTPGADAAVAENVQLRSGGNPLFAVELARLLAAEQHLDASTAVPTTVRDVVRRRLDRLPEQATAVLTVAAVAGPEIDLQLVADVADLDEDTAIDLFELAVVTGLLVERADRPGFYRFDHDLVRQAVLDALPGLRRARLHERALAAMIRRHGENRQNVHELARHAVEAAPAIGAAAAVERLLLSARIALVDVALDLARRQLQRAEELLEGLPASIERDRLEVQVQSRRAQLAFHLPGGVAEAAARNRHALQLCSPDDVEQVAGVLIGMGAYGQLAGNWEETAAAGKRLLELADAKGDPEMRACGHYLSAVVLWTGDVKAALEHAERAVVGAEQFEVPTLWSTIPVPTMHAMLGVARAVAGLGTWRDASQDAVDVATRLHNPWARAWGAAFGVAAAFAAGDRDAGAQLSRAVDGDDMGLDYVLPVLAAGRAWADGGDPASVRAAADELASNGDAMFRIPVLTMWASMLDEAAAGAAAAAYDEVVRTAERLRATGWLPVLDRRRRAAATR